MMNWAAQSCRAAAACCSKYILSSRSNQQLQFCRCGLPASLASFCVTKHKKSILYDPSIISIKEFVLRYNIITYTESEVIFIRRSLWQNVFILIFPQASHQIWSRQCGGAWAQARSAPSLLQSIVCLTDS